MGKIKDFFARRQARALERADVKREAENRSADINSLMRQKREAAHKLKVAQLQNDIDDLAAQRERELGMDEEPPQQQNEMMQFLPFLAMMMKQSEEGKQMDLPTLLQNLNPTLHHTPAAVSSLGKKTPSNNSVSLSDEEIKAIISKIPKKQLKQAKAFPPTVVKAYIKKNLGDYSDATIERAMELIA